MLDLIPGKLRWAPETALQEEATISALSLCKDQASKKASLVGSYQVHHYSSKAYGRAFGPLGLEQTLRFCANLARHVRSRSHGGSKAAAAAPLVKTLWTPPGDEAAHSNASVLIGAYLIFLEGWDADQVQKSMGDSEAQRSFPCSWSRFDRPEAKRNLRVLDCWQGFVLARKMAWVDVQLLTKAGAVDDVCERCHQLVACYDAGWLIPGQLMVSADPITTLLDPNPETFSALEPSGSQLQTPSTAFASEGGAVDRFGLMDEASWNLEDPESDADAALGPLVIDPISPKASEVAWKTPQSRRTESVSKEYPRMINATPSGKLKGDDPVDFVTFMRDSGVGLIVRANFSQEPGMQACSYDPGLMKTYGFEHLDVPWEDVNGGCPQKAHISRFLSACGGYLTDAQRKAVLVHCKGGFGRSVLLACILVVERFDVSGQAVLGWARVARPGAINTPSQEKLIASLAGRSDVLRLSGLEATQKANKVSRKQPSCIGTGCLVQ